MSEPQQQMMFSIPVTNSPEFADLTKNLIELTTTLKNEIGFLRETRGRISFTEQELADYFGISLVSMERIRRNGKIHFKRIAGKIHYTRKHVDDYLNSE